MFKYLASFLIFMCALLPLAANAQTSTDAELRNGMQALTRRLVKIWIAPCDLKHGKETSVAIKFKIAPDGNLKGEPEWCRPNSNPVWREASNRAIKAIKSAQPYENLPNGLYNRPLTMYFDAQKACQGR